MDRKGTVLWSVDVMNVKGHTRAVFNDGLNGGDKKNTGMVKNDGRNSRVGKTTGPNEKPLGHDGFTPYALPDRFQALLFGPYFYSPIHFHHPRLLTRY